MLRDLIDRLFGPSVNAGPHRKVCEACEALRGTIQVMKDHEAFLHSQILDLESALLKATRLSSADPTKTQPHIDPVPTMPIQWGSMKKKLEDKYKRKDKPEDKVMEEWEGKIKKMEGEAGLAG